MRYQFLNIKDAHAGVSNGYELMVTVQPIYKPTLYQRFTLWMEGRPQISELPTNVNDQFVIFGSETTGWKHIDGKRVKGKLAAAINAFQNYLKQVPIAALNANLVA